METESNCPVEMQGVTKVFYTDEVETHALSEIHLQIRKGEYVSIAAGIGLVLCRQIAEAHGGTLTLENRAQGGGARAQLTIPLRPL